MSMRFWQPPPGTPLDSSDPLTRGLILAPVVLGGNKVWDPTGQAWSLVTGSSAATSVPGRTGNAIRCTQANASYQSNSTVTTPTTAATILIVTKARNSGSTGSTFGASLSEAEVSNRCHAHIPYAGIIYWDYGNYSLGGRVSYTPSSGFWGVWRRMAFRAGPRQGMSIWEDGIVKVSQGTALTRTSTSGLYFGAGNSGTNDNDHEAMFVYNRELTDAEILRWTLNPYTMFAARSAVLYAPPAAPSADAAPWLMDYDLAGGFSTLGMSPC